MENFPRITVIGMTVTDVAVSFGVHRTTKWSLAQRFRTTDVVKDRPRSVRKERYIDWIVDRVWRATRVRISAQTVRNKLKACRLK